MRTLINIYASKVDFNKTYNCIQTKNVESFKVNPSDTMLNLFNKCSNTMSN
jgi:hypothetical protein